MIDFKGYGALSFDCYGTLIDWESGILAALRPVLQGHARELEDGQLLRLYAKLESQAEKGEFIRYQEVLREVVRGLGRELGFTPSPAELDSLAASLGDWPPFPDTVMALKALKRRYRLAIISNVDEDLFTLTARRLQVEFDWVITAEQARSYKPALDIFHYALRRIGVAPDKVLHIAQSLYHDIVPAKALGLAAIWVKRSGGPGATPPARGQPDLEVPDLETLVRLIGLR